MRIPVTTRGIRLIAAVALVVAAAACGDDDDSSDVVTIPSSDGSSPSVVMDAHFNVEQRPYMTVANGSAPQQQPQTEPRPPPGRSHPGPPRHPGRTYYQRKVAEGK
jgi:hypothetical protein